MNFRLRPLFISGVVFNVIFISYLEYQMIRVTNEGLDFESREKAYDNISCLSPIWLISALVEFFTVLIFYELVHKITETTEKQIEDDKDHFGYNEGAFTRQRKNLQNLWVIMKVYMVITFYQMLYAMISYCWANHIKDCVNPNHKYHKYSQCNVITNVPEIDTWFWFISRTFSYAVWLYPVIYIFHMDLYQKQQEKRKQMFMCYSNRIAHSGDKNGLSSESYLMPHRHSSSDLRNGDRPQSEMGKNGHLNYQNFGNGYFGDSDTL